MHGLKTDYLEVPNNKTNETIGIICVLENPVLYLIVSKYGKFFYETFKDGKRTELDADFNKVEGAKLYNTLDILADKRAVPKNSLMMNVIMEVLQGT